MSTQKIVGIVIGVLISIMGIALYPNYAVGFNELYLVYVDRCEISGESVLKVHDEGGNVATLTSATCKVITTNSVTGWTAAGTLFDEAGRNVGTTTATTWALTTAGEWEKPADVLSKFAGINKLLTSIGPMLVLVGFATTGIMIARQYSPAGGVSTILSSQVIALISALVAINMLPVVVTFIETSAGSTDKELSVTNQFGGIISLLWSLLPMLMNLAVISMVVWSGYSMFGGKKGAGKGEGMEMM